MPVCKRYNGARWVGEPYFGLDKHGATYNHPANRISEIRNAPRTDLSSRISGQINRSPRVMGICKPAAFFWHRLTLTPTSRENRLFQCPNRHNAKQLAEKSDQRIPFTNCACLFHFILSRLESSNFEKGRTPQTSYRSKLVPQAMT